jgi:hypothetical protein
MMCSGDLTLDKEIAFPEGYRKRRYPHPRPEDQTIFGNHPPPAARRNPSLKARGFFFDFRMI